MTHGTLPPLETRERFDRLAPPERCRRLCESWEADFLLLAPDAAGVPRMVGGGLCFPSHWDLCDKLGKALDGIHGPVPGLNEGLRRRIDLFPERRGSLPPGNG